MSRGQSTSTGLLLLFVIPAGKFLSLVQPQLPFATPLPWKTFFRSAAEVSGLSLLAITIQHGVSVRWRSFPVAVGLGLVATVTGFVITAGTARDGPAWARYFPWSLPTVAALERAVDLTLLLLFSGVVGMVVTALGCWDFCRRDVK